MEINAEECAVSGLWQILACVCGRVPRRVGAVGKLWAASTGRFSPESAGRLRSVEGQTASEPNTARQFKNTLISRIIPIK